MRASELAFPALLFQTLAVALLFLPLDDAEVAEGLHLHDHLACDALSASYSATGSKLADMFRQYSPSLATVQHDLVKCLWLKTNSRGTASWQVLGSAIRQAQALGLHLQRNLQNQPSLTADDAVASVWWDEYRRRLWITLFTWDSHMACILSRPRAINLSDCTAEPPAGCDIPRDRLTSLPRPISFSEKPPMFANRLFSYTLGRKVHEILTTSANKRTVPSYSAVSKFHGEIMSLWDNHHPALRRKNPDTSWDATTPLIIQQREYARVLATSVLLTLHRDHAPLHEESLKIATRAALALLEAVGKLLALLPAHQQRVYGFSCHCIDSCLFIAYAVVFLDKMDRDTAEKALLATRESALRLDKLADRSPLARTGFAALRKAEAVMSEHLGLDAVQQSAAGDVPFAVPSEELEKRVLDFSGPLFDIDSNGLNSRFQPEFYEIEADGLFEL
ncbi:fungal specific transcription factor domain-containing protein [Colletotrichum truncatum]|uniref:Fungal specific transcription factor domain-containing protein n=1 Tax=Colletotrichum truncatum TaxID=5467 RepID=A0ACC3Z6H5_COLTU|nr:fungal specific transcription factor domain-containing protein [Colletotrichum truncatum]KAF6788031.1 fungal specific transcription factor domain-containing protein [Colletotrichum truncatum]